MFFLHYYFSPPLHYQHALGPELSTQTSYASGSQAAIMLSREKTVYISMLSRAGSFHQNLLGYYTIYSSVLDHGRAVMCKQTTRQRGSVTSAQKTHGFLLILLLLSGDVQLNPGPVYRGIQQDSGAEPHLATTMVASHNEVSAWGFPVDLPGLPNNEMS